MSRAPVASMINRSSPKGDSGGGRHPGQRRQEAPRRAGRPPCRGRRGSWVSSITPALLDRVGQLAEGVGQLQAPRVELEPLHHAGDRVGWGRASAPSGAGQSKTNVGPDLRQLRFDAIEEHLIEDVVPGSRRADAQHPLFRPPRAAPRVSRRRSERNRRAARTAHARWFGQRARPARARGDRAPRPGRRPRPASRSRRPEPPAVRGPGTTRAW